MITFEILLATIYFLYTLRQCNIYKNGETVSLISLNFINLPVSWEKVKLESHLVICLILSFAEMLK